MCKVIDASETQKIENLAKVMNFKFECDRQKYKLPKYLKPTDKLSMYSIKGAKNSYTTGTRHYYELISQLKNTKNVFGTLNYQIEIKIMQLRLCLLAFKLEGGMTNSFSNPKFQMICSFRSTFIGVTKFKNSFSSRNDFITFIFVEKKIKINV
jgi:hypothetical protein